METLRQLVPSAGSLVVFEAAGRLMSFSAAGRELGITQAAVSYAIARLEEQLGTALFLREYRRVRLTEAGRRFHADVSLGLLHIQRAAKSLKAAAGTHVTLSCSNSFAAFWMVPRMSQFRAELPGIDLRIQTSERELDLAGEGIPLAVRGGCSPEDWPQDGHELLAPEEIYPVCGANYKARLGRNTKAEELLGHQLIHLEEPFRRAATWSDWFGSAGVPVRRAPKGLQINDYVLVIQAVIEGQGIALGWDHLVAGMVAKGALKRLTRHSLVTGKNYYVMWPRDAALTPVVRKVRDWLVAQKAG